MCSMPDVTACIPCTSHMTQVSFISTYTYIASDQGQRAWSIDNRGQRSINVITRAEHDPLSAWALWLVDAIWAYQQC